MTEDWMKRIQEENTHLKNQLRLLKENYELRAMLGHQCAGHCQGKAFRKTEPDVQQQPPVLEHFNYSPHVLSKENMALCTPSTHPQPKRFPTDPFLFQPRSGERKLSPLSSVSCAAVGGKQLEEFTDVAGLKKLWFTDSPLPGGDKPEALGPVSIAYYKAGRLLGSRDTPNSPSWSEERVSTSPLSTSRKASAHTTVSFSEELRIPEGASSPGTPARQASHLGGRALEPRTHHAQPVSEEMPRRKRVSFSEAPAADRQRKLHTFYLSELEIAQSHKKDGRIVGEIAFQLDRRVLAQVFPGITRLYGFTVSNIPEKIKQICTKSLDGSLDEKKYRAMTQRYLDLIAHLEKMGYHTDIHPVFSEFLINTYGILKQRPDLCSDPIHNNPADLRKMVIDIVPSKFLGDTLLLLNCLCELSKEDNKALFAW